jgi:hypothetical protein
VTKPKHFMKGTISVDLLEKIAATDAADRMKSLELYREILLRANAPKPGDEKKLREVMAAIGKTAADIEPDQRVYLQADALEQQAQGLDGLGPQVEAAGKKLTDYIEETKLLEQERRAKKVRLSTEFQTLQSRQEQARQAGNKLKALKARRPDLFDAEPSPTPRATEGNATPKQSPRPETADADGIPYAGTDRMIMGGLSPVFQHLSYEEMRAEFDRDQRSMLKSLESQIDRGFQLTEKEKATLERLRERFGKSE